MAPKIIPFKERFLERFVKKDDESCWEWLGYKDKDGFGKIRGDGGRKAPHYMAHNASWEINIGKLPEDKNMCVCHSCHNCSCVNPKHLYLGKRGRIKGRGRISMIDRFWNFTTIGKASECWTWTGARQGGDGYGVIRDENIDGKRRMVLAHRFSWIIHNGLIPKGLFVCHHCDNKVCVNPNHLFTGTCLDNVHDMINKGRDRVSKMKLKKGLI